MSAPTRFPNGITNVGSTDILNQFGQLDPTTWFTDFDDFTSFTTGVTTKWTETVIGTGTCAGTAVAGGAILITNSALDNDGYQLQKVPASFLLASGKKAIFKARFKVSDATQSDLLIGLNVVDTTLLGAVAGAGNTDGIFFQKDAGAATLNVYCQKDATTGQTSASAISTLADDTFVTVAWYYNGVDKVFYAVDGSTLGYLDGSSTYLPDAQLTISIALLNGAAAAKTMTVDYILAAVER